MRLQEQGLIEVLPRKGYLIRPISKSDAYDLYEMRLLLEKSSLRRACNEASDEDLASLDQFRAVENGDLVSKGNYKDGKKEGLWEQYYRNGQLLWKINYEDGKQEDGLFLIFYADGNLREMQTYIDGKRNGLSERYHQNGQLKYKENYKDGK